MTFSNPFGSVDYKDWFTTIFPYSGNPMPSVTIIHSITDKKSSIACVRPIPTLRIEFDGFRLCVEFAVGRRQIRNRAWTGQICHRESIPLRNPFVTRVTLALRLLRVHAYAIGLVNFGARFMWVESNYSWRTSFVHVLTFVWLGGYPFVRNWDVQLIGLLVSIEANVYLSYWIFWTLNIFFFYNRETNKKKPFYQKSNWSF